MHAACVTSGSVQVLCKAAVAQPLSAALHKQGSSEMGNRQRWAHRRREALRGPEPPGGRHLQYTGRRLARQKSWRQGAPGAGQGAQSLKAAGLRQEQQRRKVASLPGWAPCSPLQPCSLLQASNPLRHRGTGDHKVSVHGDDA